MELTASLGKVCLRSITWDYYYLL